MQTVLRGVSKEAHIDTNGPFAIIGEKINPTGRKKLRAALQEGDFEYVRVLAKQQIEAGADVLDVNVGVPGMDEVDLLPKVVQLIAAETDIPLCLDSANSDALAAALAVAPGKPLVNSVNGEASSLDAVLPVVKEFGAAVIGLTMDDDGIPTDPEVRVSIAGKIIERAAKLGIPLEDIVIDPLVLTVGADSNAGLITLQAVEMISREFGVNINLGASNVSFGLPDRHVLNQAFLAMGISAGASCAITDPIKLTSTIRAVDLLRGRDDYSGRYIMHFRSQQQREA